MADIDLISRVATSNADTLGGRCISIGFHRRDIRILPHPRPPTRGYHLHQPHLFTTHLVNWLRSLKASSSLKVTIPSIGSCSLSLSSLTTKTNLAILQSRKNLSLTALKYGKGVTCLVLVLKTRRSFTCTSTYADGGSGFSAEVRSIISARAGRPPAADFRAELLAEYVPSKLSTSSSTFSVDCKHTHLYTDGYGTVVLRFDTLHSVWP